MRLLGRFALALVLVIVSGSLSNAHATGLVVDLIAFLSLAAVVWAVVGLFRAIGRRRARQG